MNITLSVNGRFHTFDVAYQLALRGHLRALITSYPKFMAKRWKIPGNRVRALPIIEVARRLTLRAGLAGELLCAPYDLLASGLLPLDSDVVETWSCSSLYTIRRARRLGAVSVLKRSSAHIVSQNELLVEEHARWGALQAPIPEFVINRELREYEETDYVLASSSFIARTFHERGVPKQKVLCLPLAVDTAQFTPSPVEHDPFRIVFCGAASLRKGVQYLLQALAELRHPSLELWLVGGVHPEIRALLARFDVPRVRLVGHVPHHTLPKIYGQCDVLCLPSVEEGFGTVVSQAMACGLTAIVTENVGAADLLDTSTGRIVPIRDVEALKSAIVELLEDRAMCRAMGQRAHDKLKSGWGWSDYADKLIQLYGSIVRPGPDLGVLGTASSPRHVDC